MSRTDVPALVGSGCLRALCCLTPSGRPEPHVGGSVAERGVVWGSLGWSLGEPTWAGAGVGHGEVSEPPGTWCPQQRAQHGCSVGHGGTAAMAVLPPWAQGMAGGAIALVALCRTHRFLLQHSLQAQPSPVLGIAGQVPACSESCCNPGPDQPEFKPTFPACVQAHFPSLLPDREVGELGHVSAPEADTSLSRLQDKILFPMSGINPGLCSLLLGREWLGWPKGQRGAQTHRAPSLSVQGSRAGSGHQSPRAGCF